MARHRVELSAHSDIHTTDMTVNTMAGHSHSATPIEASATIGPRWLEEERDSCGVGFIAQQQGKASHTVIENALRSLGCMEHRGGCSADYDSGDGSGILAAVPWALIDRWAKQAGLEALDHEKRRSA